MFNSTSSNPTFSTPPQYIHTLLKRVWTTGQRQPSVHRATTCAVDFTPSPFTLHESLLPGRDDVVCLEVEGAINRQTYLRLIETACAHHCQGRRGLLLDLRQVSQIELSGFFALLSIARLYSGQSLIDPESGWDGLRQAMEEVSPALGTWVKLVAPSPTVAQRLTSSTIGQFWEQYPDRESALAALPAS